jgi:hypothetical protein
MRKILLLALITIGLLMSMGNACEDPGNPKTGGKPKKVYVYLFPGTTKITKNYYGAWSPIIDGNGGSATPNCRWSVQDSKHRLEESGGWKDTLIITTGLRGHTVTVGKACYKLEKKL